MNGYDYKDYPCSGESTTKLAIKLMYSIPKNVAAEGRDNIDDVMDTFDCIYQMQISEAAL